MPPRPLDWAATWRNWWIDELAKAPKLAGTPPQPSSFDRSQTDKVIAETADNWAFAAKWTGLTIKPVR